MKEKILISLFFIAVFLNFLGPIVDPDFPFHLKTGEYIYQHREIPQDDPFSFYGEGIITDRERFTLSQYWISQVIFYKLFSIFGPAGIIILRASVLSALVFLLWLILRKRGFYFSILIAISVTIMFQTIKADRPQFFSFFFALMLIWLIEKFREKPDSKTPLYFVPPMMLLWANMHAGFVFGIAILIIYALSEGLKFFINKTNLIGNPMAKKPMVFFLLIVFLSAVFTYINPITNNQLLTTIESHTDVNWLYKDIREYVSPIKEMELYFGARFAAFIFFFLFGFIIISLCLNVIRTRSIDLTSLALIVFSSAAAFYALRYIPFFVAVALPLCRNYRIFNSSDFLLLRRIKRSSVVYALFLMLCLFLIITAMKDYKYIFRLGPSDRYPEHAANFLRDIQIKSNVFNQFNRGSYLMWRLYPDYKFFNDTRFISLEAVYETNAISFTLDNYNQPTNLALANALSDFLSGEAGRIDVRSEHIQDKKSGESLWQRLLDKYNIDLVVLEATADFTKELYPLTVRLIKDDEWVLIYLDGMMQIFIRKKEEYSDIIKKVGLPKDFIYTEIILETQPLVTRGVPISSPYSSLAFAYMMKGNHEKARIMIDAALELDKNDIVAHFCSAYLALKQKNGNNTEKGFDVTK